MTSSMYRSFDSAAKALTSQTSTSASKATPVTTPTFHRPFETTNGHAPVEHARNRDRAPHRATPADGHRNESKAVRAPEAQSSRLTASKHAQGVTPKASSDASIGQYLSDFHVARSLELAAHVAQQQQPSALSNLQTFSTAALDAGPRHPFASHKPDRRASPKDAHAVTSRLNGAHAAEKRKRSTSGDVSSRRNSPRKTKAAASHEKTPPRASGES